jgi:hypothetical protein
VSVTVTVVPVVTVVELTLKTGAAWIANGAGEDVFPLDGSKTVTCAVPTVVRSVAGIDASNRVGPENVVTRFAPFHRTIDPDVNALPSTVRVKAAPLRPRERAS